jgi:hypothetical protein
MKKQTKKDKLDESLAAKYGAASSKEQPMSARRHESMGMKKAMKKKSSRKR